MVLCHNGLSFLCHHGDWEILPYAKEEIIAIKYEDDVLECACGTGLLTRHIAPVCRHIVATDFSEKMLERARRKCLDYGNASFEYADIFHLDYPDESFDKVIAANVIHLLDEPLKALSELDRVCRKGGSIIALRVYTA